MTRAARRLLSAIVAISLTASLAAHAVEPAANPSEGAPIDASRVIAIGVVLDPGPDMASFAKAANKGVRKAYPAGFTLGANQRPHIALVHLYVRAGDLPELEAALAHLLADDNPLLAQLAATGYDHRAWNGLALMTIDVDRSMTLNRMQAKIAAAAEPFAVPAGTADAFAVNRELPQVDKRTMASVENFTAAAAVKNYRPHITIGLAQEFVAKDIEAIRFPRRTFRPTAVAIYQLGNIGTAQKELWSWQGDPSTP